MNAMRRVRLLKVVEEDVGLCDADYLTISNCHPGLTRRVMYSNDVAICSDFDTCTSLEIHHLRSFAESETDDLIAIHPDVAEKILLPSVRDKEVENMVNRLKNDNQCLARDLDKNAKLSLNLVESIDSSGFFERLKYLLTGDADHISSRK